MQIAELIALAAIRSGKQRQALADEMGHSDKTRISKIASGRLKADASEIVYLAEAANLPPIQTLADIESERHPELAFVWAKAGATIKNKITSLYFSLAGRFHRPRFSAR